MKYIDDIEETRFEDYNINELTVMSFNLYNVNFAVDTGQASDVKEFTVNNIDTCNVIKLEERIKFHKIQDGYKSPGLLMLKNRFPWAILIDKQGESFSIDIDIVKPLPQLLDCGTKANPLWGAILRDDKVYYLLDCNML